MVTLRSILRGMRARSQSDGRLTGAGSRAARARTFGFTLIELIMVIAIIGILLALAIPNYRNTTRSAQEAVLRDDLFQMRSLIQQYTLDKHEAPQSLQDLVSAGYLSQVPADPMTHSDSTWQTETDDTVMSPDQVGTGITNVHSGAPGAGLNGTPYSSW